MAYALSCGPTVKKTTVFSGKSSQKQYSHSGIFWHSSQIKDPGLNIASFENEDADQILEAIRLLTPEERGEKYQKLEEIIVAEIPVIPLYRPVYLYCTHQKIKGIEAKRVVFPHERFTDLVNWYTEEERKWIKP